MEETNDKVEVAKKNKVNLCFGFFVYTNTDKNLHLDGAT